MSSATELTNTTYDILKVLGKDADTTGILPAVAASTSAFSNTTFLTATPNKHFVLLYQENS